MYGEQREWINRWICNPRYQKLEPLQLLHRQLDEQYKAQEHSEERKNNHTFFRKIITVKSQAKVVKLFLSADDYYKLYINGNYITQGPANSYAFCYPYNELDITAYLKEGENVLAVHVYYQGLINRAYNSGDYRQGMIAEVWADGTLICDENWMCKETKEYGATRTIAYDTQFDEVIDQRMQLTGWKERNYDISDWEPAAVKEKDDHILVRQQTKNLQMEYRRPVQTKKLTDGYLLDFGEELTGTISMKTKGRAGTAVVIRYGEELLCETAVRNDMRCNCLYEDRVILAEGENEMETFEYKCFRYVQIIMDEGADCTDFCVHYRHYPFDETHTNVVFADELLNDIWSMCRHAVKNCAQEAFLDCPHREKGQYLGDLLVSAHAFYYLTGDTTLFQKALYDFANSTRICPGMMAVAPGSFMQEIADFSLLYPYELLLYYQLSGDKETLRTLLPVAEGIMSYFKQFENVDHMLYNVKTKWNLVDWPENLRDDYDFELPQPVVSDGCHNVINALYVGMVQSIEQIKDVLQIVYEPEAKQLKQAFIRNFFCEETGLFVDSVVSRHSSLHANVFAAFYDLWPEKNNIEALVEQKGLCCGVFVAYFVLYGVLRMGNKALAYRLITNKTNHSWYNMRKEGATSTFEAWGKDQKWNTSLCHAWAAAPIPVLMEYFKELVLSQ